MSDSLEARVRQLERRFMRLSAIAAVLGLGFVLSLGSQLLPRPALDAQRFILRDSVGGWRGALMMREDGCPVIRLNDTRGKARLYGVLLPDGNPRLRLTDSSGVHRIVMELDRNALPHLTMHARDGGLRVRVSVDSAGRPEAELFRDGVRHTVLLDDSPSR